MKRIITLFSVIALVATLSAQEISAVYNGKKIENGATLTVNGFENLGGIWQSNPEIVLTVSNDMTADLQASYTDSHIQFCPEPEGELGGCIPAQKQGELLVAGKTFNLSKDKKVDLKIHWTDDFTNMGAATRPEVNTSVAFSVVYKLKTVYSFTLVFDSSYIAGIDNVAGDGSFVSLAAGNILEYNVPAGTKLDVYSLNGSTVIERTVNGHGSLSLDRLAPGVYLYKAGSLSGKVLVK